jgi:hypothetical protein
MHGARHHRDGCLLGAELALDPTQRREDGGQITPRLIDQDDRIVILAEWATDTEL